MARHYDHIDAFGCRFLDDVFVGRAKLNNLTHFHQIGEILREKFVEYPTALFQQIAIWTVIRAPVVPIQAEIDGVIDDNFCALIPCDFQSVSDSNFDKSEKSVGAKIVFTLFIWTSYVHSIHICEMRKIYAGQSARTDRF